MASWNGSDASVMSSAPATFVPGAGSGVSFILSVTFPVYFQQITQAGIDAGLIISGPPALAAATLGGAVTSPGGVVGVLSQPSAIVGVVGD